MIASCRITHNFQAWGCTEFRHLSASCRCSEPMWLHVFCVKSNHISFCQYCILYLNNWSQTVLQLIQIGHQSKELQHRQIILVTPKVISSFKFKFTYILSPNLITFWVANGFGNVGITPSAWENAFTEFGNVGLTPSAWENALMEHTNYKP